MRGPHGCCSTLQGTLQAEKRKGIFESEDKQKIAAAVTGALDQLNKNQLALAFEDVFKGVVKKCGYASLSAKCSPECGLPIFDIHIGCLKCSMIATYEK